MTKPEISILMPAIRPQNWTKVYESILSSTRRSFELVIVGPHQLPENLLQYKNIKYVRDFGSPVRASAIGSLLCEGTFIYPTHADDCFLIQDSLDNNIDILSKYNDEHVVVCKYSESENLSRENDYQNDDYYKIVNAYPVNPMVIPSHWLIFNSVIWYRTTFDRIGGFDCHFETCPMAHADLAIRSQHVGIKAILSSFPLLKCGHMPGTSGDHAPIHFTQILKDDPKFRLKYSEPLDDLVSCIDRLNWKKYPNVWKERFN